MQNGYPGRTSVTVECLLLGEIEILLISHEIRRYPLISTTFNKAHCSKSCRNNFAAFMLEMKTS